MGMPSYSWKGWGFFMSKEAIDRLGTGNQLLVSQRSIHFKQLDRKSRTWNIIVNFVRGTVKAEFRCIPNTVRSLLWVGLFIQPSIDKIRNRSQLLHMHLSGRLWNIAKQGRIHGYPSHVCVGRGSIWVTGAFGQEQWSQRPQKHKKSKMGTNRPTDGQSRV